MFPRNPVDYEAWCESLELIPTGLPRPNAKLCTDHFKQCDWKVTPGGKRRLHPGAVPRKTHRSAEASPYIRVPVIEKNPYVDEGDKEKGERRKKVVTVTNETSDFNDSYQDKLFASIILVCGTLFICFLPFLLYWLSTKRDSNAVSKYSFVKESSSKCSAIEISEADLISIQKDQRERREKSVETYLQSKGFNNAFISEVKKMKDKPQRKYTEKQISNALVIHSLSPRTYDILRENQLTYHKLPHRTTLGKRIKHFKCQPGIQTEFLNFVKVKLSGAKFWERQCLLMFDEMDLCEKFQYSERLKRVFNKHKKVQVVLLR